MKNSIAIDWLQLHVCVPQKNFEAYTASKYFTIYREPMQTRNFKTIYTIKDKKGDEVAVLAAEPRNEMCMNENSGLLKIINKHLYQKNLRQYVDLLLCDLGLLFINITRIDIAYDFLQFDTMPCKEFINGVVDATFLKSFQTKFKAMGETFSVEKGQLTGGFSSIKFGQESSDTCYYLYDKTLELLQVKHKPYIHDHWKKNGWDGSKSVYRLEFSLKPITKGIVLLDGEILTFKDLSMIDRIEDMYRYCFAKHFNFVEMEITKRGNVKKQSRSNKVVLFNELKFTPVSIELSEKKDSGRSSKIFLKALKQLNDELRGVDHDLGIVGNELFTYFAATRDLKTWAKHKLDHSYDSYTDKVLVAEQKRRNESLFIYNATNGCDLHKLGKLHQLSIRF
jgi:hypothetical protein